MFDNIAHSYDFLNHSLSFGVDKFWRRAAIKSLKPYAPKDILDVATGTGDFAILTARMLKPKSLIGVEHFFFKIGSGNMDSRHFNPYFVMAFFSLGLLALQICWVMVPMGQ